jgi:hypothetical protein
MMFERINKNNDTLYGRSLVDYLKGLDEDETKDEY